MKQRIILAAFVIGFFYSAVFHPSLTCAQGEPAKESNSAEQLILRKIEQLTTAKGEHVPTEGVYKVGFPRSDLKVEILGTKLVPALGLGVWAGFKIIGGKAMVMGDTVLTEDQVNPVLDTALENGLEVTAIHNHFFWDSPKIMFMHIGGSGDIEKLAAGVGKIFSKIRETADGKGEKPFADIDPSKTTLDPSKIEAILGVKGQMAAGVYKITVGRTTNMHGQEAGKAMGVNTWAAFAGSDELAVADGDFAMLESEVQPVLRALRAAKINIVALHSHMLMESPRMIFLHFWGVGSTTSIAKGLKAALDTQKK
jgi:hypothetical protein